MAADRRIALLPVALLLNACAATATENTVCHGQRIIIRFAPGVDVTRTGFNEGLTRDAGVPVDYMRPLFDDYHLYCAGLEGPEPSLDEVLEHLQDRQDIRAVDIDRIKHRQIKRP